MLLILLLLLVCGDVASNEYDHDQDHEQEEATAGVAPEVGFEPTIRLRRINSRQYFSTRRGLARLQRSLPQNRGMAGRHGLGMNQNPRATKALCRAGQSVHRIVMLADPPRKVAGLADVQFAIWIAQYINAPLGERIHGQNLAPEVGFEPTTNRLTADRSTTELLWNRMRPRR